MIRGPLGDIQKWGLKIRRQLKKIKTRDGNTIDALDLDFLLGEMLESFREQRRLMRAELQKTFTRVIESNMGNCDLDQFIEIHKQGIPVDETW